MSSALLPGRNKVPGWMKQGGGLDFGSWALCLPPVTYIQPRLFYPVKLSFRMEGQRKCFPDKVKLKEFIITKPLSYAMLKGLI